MNIVTIVGARPQFIKAAAVSRAVQRARLQGCDISEQLLHTGQHYDYNMSGLFFSQLGIPAPAWNLGCRNNDTQMTQKIASVLQEVRPDLVIVYGDTFSTLAGARAAVGLDIPVAHVEAGLRSFNDAMPEEYNRIQTDRISRYLFCPTHTAVENLRNEGREEGVYLTGDVMYDATLMFTPDVERQQQILHELGICSGHFALATIHRADTAEDPEKLHGIFMALSQLGREVILPLHPHTARTVSSHAELTGLLADSGNIRVIEPVGYQEMLVLEKHAFLILTDSGGVQKEAYFQRTPCITLREETEWTETVTAGWNRLAGTDTQRILAATAAPFHTKDISDYGTGSAADIIIQHLISA